MIANNNLKFLNAIKVMNNCNNKFWKKVNLNLKNKDKVINYLKSYQIL